MGLGLTDLGAWGGDEGKGALNDAFMGHIRDLWATGNTDVVVGERVKVVCSNVNVDVIIVALRFSNYNCR